MFDLADDLLAELDAGRPVAVVVVTAVNGSAPRAVGSAMALTGDGRVIGSISGGCVEGESYELAREVMESGLPARAEFGFSDDDALLAGLSCGGHLTVAAARVETADAALISALREASAGRAATYDLHTRDGIVSLEAKPAPRMIIVGAVDFSAALADAAVLLGYRVTVCDPRGLFATPARFPTAHEVAVAWPQDFLAGAGIDESTVICVLTHEERFDIPALTVALGSPAAYVGAMGSRRTHERRLALLTEAGVPAEQIARLHSPIGLDLGGSTPQETAVAIVAEIIAERTGASARPLRATRGAIHARGSHHRADAATL